MRLLKRLCLFAAVCACLLAVLSAAVYHLPWAALQGLPEAKRDQLVSLGVVSPASHPLYREWLLNFVRTPEAPRPSTYSLDTPPAYGGQRTITVDDAPSDALGFANAIKPSQARVLFVGDSFCNGASAGTNLSPPAQFARITGASVYNASNGGYGPAQYQRILERVTRSLPPGERFDGKDVVVLSYLGNDLSSDSLLYLERLESIRHAWRWQLTLGPLRAWVRYLWDSRKGQALPYGPQWNYSGVPMICATPDGQPFSWHPGYASYLFQEGLDAQFEVAARLFEGIAAQAPQGGKIRLVLVPSSLQALEKDIDWARLAPGSPPARDLRPIIDSMDRVREKGVALFGKLGFDVLDLTPIFRADPDRCLYYQPEDTHCTAKGYEAIARAIAARWPELGRSGQ
ncbi:hypothetical protein NNJEOMEG_03339 [Fundidesulfovibrio magnetotacticus]|uniref:SGNH hydrolase-type esterase domain-containing protein n=1 Tax=Fundidesulfovibrio magnetotacticus TaxID=2730080 RepID=A0A6V8LUQ9_9BACT|nr:hypothetical protein [Fundidesulfovibrio magnetotacticus]GFK95474.1 hypothetical protein NNJEOMEG_03339 [Fundidesulfovibrio magnetotacticus]